MLFGRGAPTLLENAQAYASPSRDDATAYDYIIVGAGTAGCVLASRLSEDANLSVLVIEAGGSNDILEAKAPLTFGKLFKGPKDWNYDTVPQPNVDGRQLYWPRGKMLGGCSSMNAMMYHHASHTDYDEWERLGCKGWAYRDLQPFFRKAEKYTPNAARPKLDLAHRGADGLWQTGHSHLSEVGSKAFIPACEANGIPFVPDVNTPSGTEGVTNILTFIDPSGRRSSAATAYLPAEIQKRPNLTIGINAMVCRVLFDGKRAVGVEIQNARDGPSYFATARTRVILAAGAVNTPQTLMLSGIGPRAHLEQHGISVLVDNANVGAHMRDHFCASVVCARAKAGKTLDYLTNDLKAIPALLRWLTVGGGPVSNNVGEAAAFLRSTDPQIKAMTHPLTKPENRTFEMHGSLGVGPDLEIICTPIAYLDHGFTPAPAGHNVISMVPIGLRPKSEGSVTLRSASPWDKAQIDPRYWTDEGDNDRKVLLAGLRLCIALLHHDAFKDMLEPLEMDNDESSLYWPMNADPDKVTDDQLWKWMTKRSFTLYHPVTSARMAPSPADGVVGLDLSVHGVEGLSVCDASIFPEQISGHPTAAIIAIAEKYADMLKTGQVGKPGAASQGPQETPASHL